jgi:hypothetical protein
MLGIGTIESLIQFLKVMRNDSKFGYRFYLLFLKHITHQL